MNCDGPIAFAIGIIVGALFIGGGTVVCQNSMWKTEAVEKGYAEWVIINEKTGETKWQWKPNDQP